MLKSYLYIEDKWIDPSRKSNINANNDNKCNSIDNDCNNEKYHKKVHILSVYYAE